MDLKFKIIFVFILSYFFFIIGYRYCDYRGEIIYRGIDFEVYYN